MNKNIKILLYVVIAVVVIAVVAFIVNSTTGGKLFQGYTTLDLQLQPTTTSTADVYGESTDRLLK